MFHVTGGIEVMPRRRHDSLAAVLPGHGEQMTRQRFGGFDFLRLARHGAASLVLLVTFCGCALAQSSPHPPPVPAQQPEVKQDEGTQKALEAIASEVRAIRDEAAKRDEEQKAEKLSYWWEKLPELANIAVTACGAIVAIYALLALIRQTTATEKAAKSAQDSADVARDALVAVQRAFVAVTSHLSVRFETMLTTEGPKHFAIIELRFENAGATPAKDVIGRMSATRSVTPPSNEEILGPILGYGLGYIAPKAPYYLQLPMLETVAFGTQLSGDPPQIAPATTLTPNETLYVYGWVGYRDIFDRAHVTQYCCMLMSASRLKGGGISWTWSDVGSRCGIDEGCVNYAAIVGRLPR